MVDLKKREQVALWPTGISTNVALALDEGHKRLFDGVRDPATLIVQDTGSGKQVAQLEGDQNEVPAPGAVGTFPASA